MNRRNLMVVALVAATSWPVVARAQQVEHGRGDINAIDLNRGQVELKDPQGKVRTWSFERDATVKVSDDSRPFTRNPTTADLRAPMYVHFTYVKDVIQTFDIIEIRAAAGNSNAGRGHRAGEGRRSAGNSGRDLERASGLAAHGRRARDRLRPQSAPGRGRPRRQARDVPAHGQLRPAH